MGSNMALIENCKKVAAAGVVLKKMKKSDGLDGLSWSCDVQFKGKTVGSVGEDGNGGPVRVDIKAELLAQLVEALKAMDYPLDLDLGEGLMLDAPTTDYGYAEPFSRTSLTHSTI
jgi:hypothetical protein